MTDQLLKRLRDHLWERDGSTHARPRLMYAGRFLYVLGRELLEGQLNMRAMSLVYTTLLSIVPLLALAFSVLKALGAHNSLEPVLLELLRPLGMQAYDITRNVIGFVEKIQVGVLGSLGVALLFYSAVSLIQKVESSFNFIWHVNTGRPLSQRLGEYMAVLTVGPVLVFSALGVTATMMSSNVVSEITAIEPFGFLLYLFTRLLPYVLIIGAFTFLYSFVPNTPVRLRAAFSGGLLAGVLWQSGSLLFASFVASTTNYNAIYSGFAIMIFLLIWMYLGWLILLIGCQLAFYVQHPERLQPHQTTPELTGREAEYLGLMIMMQVGQRFLKGAQALRREDLAKALNVPVEHVVRITSLLLQQGLLAETGRKQDQLIPGRDLDSIRLHELWLLSRGSHTDLPRCRDSDARRVHQLLETAEAAFAEKAQDRSLRQWLLETEKSQKTA